MNFWIYQQIFWKYLLYLTLNSLNNKQKPAEFKIERKCSIKWNGVYCSCVPQREKKSTVESQKISLLDLMKKQITVKRQRDFLDSDDESVVSYKIYQELQDSYVTLKKRFREKDVIIVEKDSAIRKLSEKCRKMTVELDKIRQLNICLQEQLFLKEGLKVFFFLDHLPVCLCNIRTNRLITVRFNYILY